MKKAPIASAPDLPWSASRKASAISVIAKVAMRRRRSSMPSTCLYSAGALTPKRIATAARLTDPIPVSSASSAAEATTSEVLRPALGIGGLGEKRQNCVCNLLWLLRVGIVARVLDHDVPGPTSRE